MEDRAVRAESNEVDGREAKLKEQTASQPKDKDDALIKEHTWTMDEVALLDHSKVQHRLATDRGLANEEQAKGAEERTKVESDQVRAVEG